MDYSGYTQEFKRFSLEEEKSKSLFNQQFELRSKKLLLTSAKKAFEKETKTAKNVLRYVENTNNHIEALCDFSAGLKGRTSGYIVEDIVNDILISHHIKYEREVRYSNYRNIDLDKKIDFLLYRTDGTYLVVYVQKSLMGGGAQTDRINSYLSVQPKKVERYQDSFLNIQWDKLHFDLTRAPSKHFKEICAPDRAKYLMYPSAFTDYLSSGVKKGVFILTA